MRDRFGMEVDLVRQGQFMRRSLLRARTSLQRHVPALRMPRFYGLHTHCSHTATFLKSECIDTISGILLLLANLFFFSLGVFTMKRSEKNSQAIYDLFRSIC